MIRHPQRSNVPDTLLPDAALFRSVGGGCERRRRLGDTRIEARQRARLGAVNPQEARRQRFDGVVVVRLADRSEATLQPYRHAVADETGDRGEVERPVAALGQEGGHGGVDRSEEHTSELQTLMRISYAVFCLKN